MFFNIINNIFVINILFKHINKLIIRYPSPRNIGFLWNYGFLSGIFLTIQIVTGLFLTMFYIPHIDHAFNSIDYIMTEINYGWFIRYIHANGASFFFYFVYIHILRGIYYSSYQYPRLYLWISGMLIYFLLMGTAFLGYVLPWGQMSFWAATVITNLLTIFPFIGENLVYWIWGGYAINNCTLNRFFCLHYLLPFVLFIIVILHVILLHQPSSTNKLGLKTMITNKLSFFPYFLIKDLISVMLYLILFSSIVFFNPEIFNHSVNYIEANPGITPPHIVPEWYFLPFYAILRCILNKTIGIILMFLSIIVLFLFPILDTNNLTIKIFNYLHIQFFWLFTINFIFLGFLGSQTIEYPGIELGIICTILHYLYIIIYFGLIVNIEKIFYL